jgi:hypothetical protein
MEVGMETPTLLPAMSFFLVVIASDEGLGYFDLRSRVIIPVEYWEGFGFWFINLLGVHNGAPHFFTFYSTHYIIERREIE